MGPSDKKSSFKKRNDPLRKRKDDKSSFKNKNVSTKNKKDEKSSSAKKVDPVKSRRTLVDPKAIGDYMHDQAGFLELDEGEAVETITQHDILDSVDITSAQKSFDLKLDRVGPYRFDYTRDGRFLAIAGERCHVATMDWQTKKLHCEVSVLEKINDVHWLHQETMFAVAQKQWTYIYDNQGIEVHCLKSLDNVLRLEYLPYHFLLVAAHAKSYLTWLDTSVGQAVAGFPTGLGRLDVICQNPSNAVIHLGHSGGTVTLWSPNVKGPLRKMLCHGSGTRAIAVDRSGNYMATSGLDRKLKIWDLRKDCASVQSYQLSVAASDLSFSQRGLLAAGLNNIVEIYKDVTTSSAAPYLCHRLKKCGIRTVKFCPYEDILGIGHTEGFSSILVPGAGEPNYDALEANPFQTKKQRNEAEVQRLLEKIPAEMISVDTTVGSIDKKTLREKLDEKVKLMFVKPEKVEFEPRKRMKGKSKSAKREQRKQGVKDARMKAMIEQIKEQKEQAGISTGQAKKEDNLKPMFKLFQTKRA